MLLISGVAGVMKPAGRKEVQSEEESVSMVAIVSRASASREALGLLCVGGV